MRFTPHVFAIIAAALIAPGVSLAQGPVAARSSSASAWWKDVNERAMTESLSPARKATAKRDIVPLAYRTVQLDRAAFGTLLAVAPREFTAPLATGGLEILLPLPYGGFGRFLVQESPIMEKALADKHPEIKTFVAQGVDDPTATARLDLTPRGFHAIVLSAQGQFFIDPYWSDDDTVYISYYKRNFVAAGKTWGCGVPGKEFDPAAVLDRVPSPARPTGQTLRIFRLALSATGEYTAAVSGTTPGTVPQALAAMITSVNRVSAVYERDLAIRLVLVNNTDRLIFTDPATDGFSNNDGVALLGENQTRVDAVIGTANYDIGHVFSTGGGGIAGLGVVCAEGAKARGVTGLPNPTGDPYDIDFVIHEMGHQFGANHPFNGTSGNCSGGNRNGPTAYEPGSGTSIMAYAGICAPQDLAPHSDDYFHTISYDEIDAYTAPLACPQLVATGNTPPTIAAPGAFTIPSGTPFALTASATDPNGDTLTYCWEEFDLGPAQDPTADPRDNGASPLFRSFDPSPSPRRTFPSLTYILNNANVPPAVIGGGFISGEFLPTTSRTMNFRVTVRDNRPGGGGSNYATATVTSVATAGPFRVSSFNTAATIVGGSTQTITWDVAGTSAAPISCTTVNIRLSADGGRTFPTALATGVANTGSASVVIPNLAQVATTQGRIRVEAATNIFFDINDADLTVTSTNTAPTLTVTGAVTVARGTPTPTVATVATASSPTAATPLTVAVSDLPGDVLVSPSIDAAGNVTLAVRADCSIVTTRVSRTYPITLTVTDRFGSTRAEMVNLVIVPNPAPTIGTYADVSVANNGQAQTVAPSAAPADANGNFTGVSVLPTTLPGGGTVSVNPSTGVVTVTATSSSTLGTVPVRVVALDSCGAAAVRLFNVSVVSLVPFPVAGPVGPPTAEGCAPANGAVDPGEIVTLSLPLTNLGLGSFSNLVGTLQSSGGVMPVGGASQTYGAVAGGATASRQFQLMATGTCGGTVTATLQLQDGATNYGTLTYVIQLGALQTVTFASENFDGVTPPALPAGWTSTVINGPIANWTTSTTAPDTAPNAVSTSPPGVDAEVLLDSPAFNLPASGVNQVRFRHFWNTEAGYDGGVLEVSANGGAFTDVIQTGGVFVSGAYTGSIDPQSSSPLGGRAAWTGDGTAGYTTTLVTLPASMNGQGLRLRFRLASDESVTPGGAVWRVDTVQLLNSFYVCASCTQAPQFTSSPPPSPAVVGTPYSFQFTATGSPTPTFSVTGGMLPPGLTLSPSGLLSGTPTSAGTGSFPNITVTATNGVSPSAAQSFSLAVVTQAANYLASFGVSSGLRSDPDGDGIANLLEYALQLNPRRASTVGLPIVQVKTYADDGLRHQFFTFTRSSLATDLVYLVETSPDLLTWTTIATSSAGAVTSGPGFVSETGTAPTFTVEVRDPQPLGTAPGSHKFMRLRVTTPP